MLPFRIAGNNFLPLNEREWECQGICSWNNVPGSYKFIQLFQDPVCTLDHNLKKKKKIIVTLCSLAHVGGFRVLMTFTVCQPLACSPSKGVGTCLTLPQKAGNPILLTKDILTTSINSQSKLQERILTTVFHLKSRCF